MAEGIEYEKPEFAFDDGAESSGEEGGYEDTAEDEEAEEDFFTKGYLIALGILALFSVSFFALPLAGLVVTFIVGPYLGGYLGGKRTCHGTLLGFLVGMTWASIMIIIIIFLAGRVSISGMVRIGRYEMAIIVLIYFFNIVFCSIGGWMSSSKVPTCAPSG